MGATRDHIHSAKAPSRNRTDGDRIDHRNRTPHHRTPQIITPQATMHNRAESAAPVGPADAVTADGKVTYRPLEAQDLPAIIDEYDQTWGFRPLSGRRPL